MSVDLYKCETIAKKDYKHTFSFFVEVINDTDLPLKAEVFWDVETVKVIITKREVK